MFALHIIILIWRLKPRVSWQKSSGKRKLWRTEQSEAVSLNDKLLWKRKVYPLSRIQLLLFHRKLLLFHRKHANSTNKPILGSSHWSKKNSWKLYRKKQQKQNEYKWMWQAVQGECSLTFVKVRPSSQHGLKVLFLDLIPNRQKEKRKIGSHQLHFGNVWYCIKIYSMWVKNRIKAPSLSPDIFSGHLAKTPRSPLAQWHRSIQWSGTASNTHILMSWISSDLKAWALHSV